ncbi:hypothetical protein RS9916_29654 [Synechococcus sp. RS9916]|nr:hypothetical protein RS9916_29654 [Synechococcus sp. RS9916]
MHSRSNGAEEAPVEIQKRMEFDNRQKPNEYNNPWACTGELSRSDAPVNRISVPAGLLSTQVKTLQMRGIVLLIPITRGIPGD